MIRDGPIIAFMVWTVISVYIQYRRAEKWKAAASDALAAADAWEKAAKSWEEACNEWKEVARLSKEVAGLKP